jgi:hypothetical protein
MARANVISFRCLFHQCHNIPMALQLKQHKNRGKNYGTIMELIAVSNYDSAPGVK